MGSILAPGRLRSALIGTGAFGAILIFTQIVLPGGRGGAGTPLAILFTGFIAGLLNALLAAGLLLIYRTTRIINFAQGALGAAGSVFTYNLAVILEWPFLLAFVAGVIVAALLGLIVELGFIRRFFDAPRLVLTVLTIALVGFLGFATGFVRTLPIFGSARDRDLTEIPDIPMPFPNFTFQVTGLPLPFDFGDVFAIIVAIAAMLGLAYFFRYTRAGVAIRASAENSERAQLLGIPVKGLSTIVWTLAGTLSGVGLIASSAASGRFTGAGDSSPALLITALAAAVIAKMRSLPVAIMAALGISIVREAVRYSYPNELPLVDVALWVTILVALLFQRERRSRSEAAESSSWKATQEQRAIPKELLAVPGVRIWRWVLIGVGLLTVLFFPWVVASGQANIAGFVAISAIVVLSLVVLTGWAGQVSLGQFAFVAVGAIVGGSLTSRLGWSFWIALPIGAVVTSMFAVLVGLPALRIKGLFLGITTFAFAFAVQAALFNERYFGWLLPERVDRPALFGFFDFEDERSMYYLTIFALVLSIVLVTTLRKSRAGRVLIAIRDNDVNAQSFGVNLVRTQLAAFALSGFLCGFAGVLLAHHQRAVSAASFRVDESINVFLYGVVGGIGSVSGAILGTLYFAFRNLLQGNPIVQFFVGQAGILVILYMAPGGLASVAFGLRDSILRIVAQRRQIVVPSLFADIDPEAASLQVAPLAEPIPQHGLAALPFHQRYKLGSYLHGRRRQELPKAATVRDSKAIGAAAESIEAIAEASGVTPGAPA